MELTYIEDEIFENCNFKNTPPTKGEYQYCRFVNCDFSNVDISDFMYIECEFSGCNFSMARLTKTTFRDTKFWDCKMLGLHFDDCNEFGLSFSFENCILHHSTFYKTKIKKTIFQNSQLQ